jgi:dCMP deaminase
MTRPDWDTYFAAIAVAVSARADCRRARHGCVIVDDQQRIVSTGYNGSPVGDERSCLAGDCPRGLMSTDEVRHNAADYSNCIALHAEANAVAYGDGARMRGGTAYITGPPCDMCAKLLAAAGLTRIVHPPLTT